MSNMVFAQIVARVPGWLFGLLIAVLRWTAGIAGLLVAHYYTHSRDFGPRAEVQRQIEETASRLSLRKTLSDLEERNLSGKQLHKARKQSHKAVNLIRQEGNENLAILDERRREPTPRMDISRASRFFLFYEPRYGKSEYATRAMYWFLLLCVFGLLSLGAWTAWHYARFDQATQDAFRQWLFSSPAGRRAKVQYLVLLSVLTSEAYLFWRMGRRERPARRKLKLASQL